LKELTSKKPSNAAVDSEDFKWLLQFYSAHVLPLEDKLLTGYHSYMFYLTKEMVISAKISTLRSGTNVAEPSFATLSFHRLTGKSTTAPQTLSRIGLTQKTLI